MKLLSLAMAGLVCGTLGANAAVPIGYVDNIDSNGTVYGWAKDPDVPNTFIYVDVYADSLFAGHVLANYYHDPVAGTHGFRLTLPESCRNAPHNIYVYGIDATGDPNTKIQNGDPYPSVINVAANDRCVIHSGGGPTQLGTVLGGRPGNASFTAKTISSPTWIGSGLQWFQTGDTPIAMTAAPRLAGGISSIIWDNVQFIEAITHGAGVTYLSHDTGDDELFNPTENGSYAEDLISGYGQSLINLTTLTASQNPPDPVTRYHNYSLGSSSSIQALALSGVQLHTKTRMAYFIPNPAFPIWTGNGGGYPKATNTIYDHFHSTYTNGVPPPNPPGLNPNGAFWSDNGSGYGRGGRYIVKPDTLSSVYFNGEETLSDQTVEKFVSWGVAGHPDLANVALLKGSLTMPATPNTLDFALAVYADQQRFHNDVGAHTYKYNPTTRVATDVTGQMSPGFPGTTDAYIVVGAGNRYAMGVWSRSPLVKTWVYQTSNDVHLYSLLRPAPIPSTSLSMTQYLEGVMHFDERWS